MMKHTQQIAIALGALLATAAAGATGSTPPASATSPAASTAGFDSTPAVPVAPVAPVAKPANRPRIGLVLAGGGAKGGAHVGVLKVLEQMHVPVDCIAGTSMGALVGGGYASGIPADGLEKFLLGIEWPKVVGGVGLRGHEPIEQKRAGVTYSNSLDMGLRGAQVVVPGGLISTAGIDDLLRSYVAKARGISNFDNLPIPYRAVATDMVSGQMVVLSDGDLATAMRASMAIPGAFEPVQMNDWILNDGGMVRNLPVDVARHLCADVVIAVNLVKAPIGPEKLQTATQLAGRAMDVMIEANVEQQLATLGPADVRVDVHLGDIGTADFERIPETIPLGEQAAIAVADQLRQYSVPEAEYVAWRQRVTENQEIDAQVADVRFEGLENVNPAYLATLNDIKPGDAVDNKRISDQARNMSAVEDIDSVGYRLDGDPSKPVLTWLPTEKSWGPNYLKFDLGLYGSDGGDSGFILYFKQERRWLNSLGLQWRNELQVGYNSLLSTSLYQPLDVAQRFFVEPKIAWTRDTEYLYEDDSRLAQYAFSDFGGSVDLGINFGDRAQWRAGYLYTNRNISVETGDKLLPNGRTVDAGITSGFIWDTRDTAFNPTRGVAAAIDYNYSNTSLGADRDWQTLEGGVAVAVPFRGDIVWLSAAGGSDLDSDLPIDRYFTLGGPGSFPGLQLGQLRTPDYWTVSGSYLWKLADIMSLRGQALYLGARLETGEVNDWLTTGGLEPLWGGSLSLTGRTMVGPLTLGIGATSMNTWSLWIAVGRPVGQGTILERGIFR